MKKIMIVLTFMLTGCQAVLSEEGFKSENKYRVDCSGALSNIEACITKARDVCPNGYNELSRKQPEPEITLFNPGIGQQNSSPTISRNMIVECKNESIVSSQ